MWIQWSGKGTQAAKILENYDFVSLETGDMLRTVLKDTSHRHYEEVNATVPHGKMTPDSVIFDLIEECIQNNEWTNILIDGAIRNIAQRNFFDAITTDYAVISLNLSKEVAIERIQGRKMDPETKEIFGSDFSGDINPKTWNTLIAREDDKDIQSIQERFGWFETDIVPLLNSWREDETKVYEIDASGSREDVWHDIQSALKDCDCD